MRRTRYLAILTLTLTAAASAVGQVADKPAVDPARWVPDDALAYVGIVDINKLSDEFQQTVFYKMTQELNAKELPGRMSLPLKIYERFKDQLAKVLDTEPDKLKNPFGGPMALYFPTPRGEPADNVKAVFMTGIGDTELMRSYYDQTIRKIREKADDYEKVSFGAYTIDRFTRETRLAEEEDDEQEADEFGFESLGAGGEDLGAVLDEFLGRLFSPEALPEELVFCLTEDRLIVAPTPEHVKDVLRRERVGGSLVESEAYKTLLREFRPLGSLRFLINLPGLFAMMEAVEGAEATDALTLLGAKSARGLIGHVLFDGQQFESKFEALLLLSGERTGLAKILSMKNRAVTPPTTVSADSLVYASVNANAMEIIDELERMIRRDDPQAADEMHAGLESIELPDGETLNLRKEVLENLREPLTFALAFRRPYGPQSTRIRMTLGHRDQEAMARFLEKLSSMWPGMMIEREVRGTLAYDVLGGFSLAPAADALIVGTTNAVDAALQAPTPEESLAADPMFKRAAALAPVESWGLVYVDSRRMFEAALEMAKNKDALVAAQLTNPANMIALSIVGAFTQGIDEDQIDAARQISKYLAPSIVTVATTPDGIHMAQIDLLPEKE